MVLNLKEALGAWHPLLHYLFEQSFMAYIGQRLGEAEDRLQPALPNVFRALQLCPPEAVKVVLLGQDPYPGGQADGLAFSSGSGDMPYSLGVIFEELWREYGVLRTNPSLEDWARQGVLLLNTSLTTTRGVVGAHMDIGWDKFTGRILKYTTTIQDMVYLQWGTYAKGMLAEYVLPGNTPRAIFRAPHPGAQRHGYNFIGCNHFCMCNEYLTNHGKTPIQWIE